MRRAVSLLGAAFALLFVLILFVLPAGAQNDGGIPPGTPANGSNPDNPRGNPDIVTIASEGCRVAEGASVTLQDDENETRAIFTDNEKGIEIFDVDGRVRIKGPDDDPSLSPHATFPDAGDTSFSTNGNYKVVSSTGITGCTGGGASPAQAQYEQYQKADGVDSAKDVIPETIKVKKVPDTGGPPYIALGALVLLSVSVVVGGRILRP
ncbi:MAG TPA: hypothetical protein VHM69_16085 [Rubrobacter sp.]|nr:hypothetical protein [Rubrobacter sp.]